MERCTRCGGPVDERGVTNDEQGYAYCETCENDFQAAMRERYPFGQCWQCGAEYKQFTCEQGKTHTEAFHAEGACSMWRDGGPPMDAEGIAAGFCSYGCHPTVSRDEVWTAPYFPTGEDAPPERWDDDMPF